MFLLIFYLLLAILVSFLCSILEAVLLSITPSYVASKKGTSIGKKLAILKDDIDKPLSSILSLNTIAHTFGAAGVGAQASVVFGGEEGDSHVGIISIILTLLILIFSEIIPKSLGANYWRSLAPFTANTLTFLKYPMYPFILISKLITKLLAKKDKNETSISREEMLAMADLGQEEGVFEERETKAIRNLIEFKSVQVEDIMTPRTVVTAVSENQSVGEVYNNPNREFLRFSRIPVFQENKDNMVGFIHKHDLLDKMAQDQYDLPLKDIKRKIITVSADMPIPEVFQEFIHKKEHIALVVDKYGGTDGIVTMEDILENLLGMEIVDEFDNKENMQAYAREQWQKRSEGLNIISDRGGEEGAKK